MCNKQSFKFSNLRPFGLVWFGFLRINVDLAIFQPYLDLEAGDNQFSENSSGEAGNRTPVLLLRKPRV